jgi:hypothetical protein
LRQAIIIKHTELPANMAPWLHLLERWAVEQLLRTPGFHRVVEKVAKNVHRVRNGLPREEAGGTNIDRPDGPGFGKHFYDELKTQLGRAERAEQNSTILREESKIFESTSRTLNNRMPRSDAVKDESSDAAWRDLQRSSKEGSDAAWQDIQRSSKEPPNQGFMSEYMEALKSQLRNEQKPK